MGKWHLAVKYSHSRSYNFLGSYRDDVQDMIGQIACSLTYEDCICTYVFEFT
jgi:hypothetical protein